MKRVLIIAAILVAGAAQAAPTAEQCSAAAELSAGALKWRQAGISEDVAMEYLRQRKVYSGLPVWAVKAAYDAPTDTPAWMLKGHVMSECGRRQE